MSRLCHLGCLTSTITALRTLQSLICHTRSCGQIWDQNQKQFLSHVFSFEAQTADAGVADVSGESVNTLMEHSMSDKRSIHLEEIPIDNSAWTPS